jgi:hypothetical protein
LSGQSIENGVYRRWSYILADVLAMDNLHVGAAPRAFLRIFSEVTYIRTVGNSTLLKNLYIVKELNSDC